ncbi:SIMPL domain-containing protein [Sorangium sp. So ce726]|uniref:SIMPL domain-containing protein n=1 Tax=Sorangium sp. So ce726 TaxID=3133319 RepID=UPI003F63F70A
MRPMMPTLTRSLIAGLALGVMTCISSTALAGSPVAGRLATDGLAAEEPEATAENAENRTITIGGAGEVTRPADSMRTSIGVEAREKTLGAARDKAASRSQAVLAALRGLAIPGLEIRTVNISLSPIQESSLAREEITEPRIIGYSASSQLAVALRGVSPAELQAAGSKILQAALTSGANDVGGLEFFLSNPTEARRAALAAAVQDAQANAKAVAKAANIRIVELQSISVVQPERDIYAQQMKGGFGGADGFPVEPGKLRITAAVTVRVAFAPNL